MRSLVFHIILLGISMLCPRNAHSKDGFEHLYKQATQSFQHNDFDDATLHFQQAISNFLPADDSVLLGECYLQLSTIHAKIGQIEAAEKNVLLAYKIFQELGVDEKIVLALRNRGNIFMLQGEFDLVDSTLRQALPIAQKLEDKTYLGYILNNYGVLYYSQKEYSKAIEYYSRVLELSRMQGDMLSLAMSEINIGISAKNLGKYRFAEQHILKGLDKSEKLNDPYHLEIGYSELAILYEETGRYKEAYAASQKAHQYYIDLINQESNQRITDLEVKYNTQRKELALLQLKKEMHKSEIEAIENKNKINSLRTTIGLVVGALLLSALFMYLFFKQYKAKLHLSRELKDNELTLQAKNKELKSSLKRNEQLHAVLKKDLDHLKQLAYRKQMNPHFIFNSLNALQNYILTNNKIEANYFLGELSTLIRRILENSEEDTISLKEELFVCETYIKLEQKRFEGKFAYYINSSPDIDLATTKIPPLLLQPFIENAIWHGLLHREGNATLYINVQPEAGGNVVISIRDNGVGRHFKAEGASVNGKKQSMGIQMTMERVNISNMVHDALIDVDIIDHFEEQKPAGTEVRLTIKSAEQWKLATRQS